MPFEKAKKPFFKFTDIPNINDFSFEKLALNNSRQLFELFQFDNNEFVDERFKNEEQCKEYAEMIETYSPYSHKHGGMDWFWKIKNDYAGILHLYDMNLETFAENNRRCWIGFATNKQYRDKGFTSKVLMHFINYILDSYPQLNYIYSMTKKENIAAQNFLLKNGFLFDPTERISKDYLFYIQTRSESYNNYNCNSLFNLRFSVKSSLLFHFKKYFWHRIRLYFSKNLLMRNITLLVVCLLFITACHRKSVPEKTQNATIITNPNANKKVVPPQKTSIREPKPDSAISTPPVAPPPSAMIVVDGYGKVLTPSSKLPADSSVKADYTKLSRGFTPQELAISESVIKQFLHGYYMFLNSIHSNHCVALTAFTRKSFGIGKKMTGFFI